MSNTRSSEGERQTFRTVYDPERVKHEVLAISDYYLRERRKEGRRYTYRCPGCGGRRFEVEPVRGMAGCFSAGCGVPRGIHGARRRYPGAYRGVRDRGGQSW